ncbi:sulfite exporter TauE/SafE family protein [Kineothrix sedimenti]|uniref:Sulfite exporter TauE/SafE family protein n=1 Tax=Kineothrix sedimenti TaxID=3123317 RepID=A0ABZ3ETA3_9FIRM
MKSGIKSKTLRIGGMTCVNCQNKIEKKLRNTAGIQSATVSYNAGTADVTYDTDIISLKDIISVIERLDYEVLMGNDKGASGNSRTVGLLLIIFSLYIFIQQFGLLNMLVPSQLAEANMGYGMLFVIGLITSVHCVAMCGGINLSQCIPGRPLEEESSRFAFLRPAFLYNFGRVISYTIVGFIVGALGSVFTFSNTMQGALKLAAGVFMVIMGINMLGIFPWLRRLNPRMPRVFARKINAEKGKSKSPLIVGLLNGLMPCGPLQAMQIYALSTGNAFAGAMSMFLFSMGTVPLMFGLGAVGTALGKKFTNKIMPAGAVLVVVLGLSMFSQGVNLAGIYQPLSFAKEGGSEQTDVVGEKTEDGEQVVNSTLSSGRYPDITVQAGMPVKWVIDAPQGSINGCNNEIYIREYGIQHKFTEGENIIEFTPEETGTFQYTCWMGMIRGTITVVEGGDDDSSEPIAFDSTPPAPEPEVSDYVIPVENIVIAEPIIDDSGNDMQQITITLTDDGFQPAVAIVQTGMNVLWNIDNQSASGQGLDQIIAPAYYAQLSLAKGENSLYFLPSADFEFYDGSNQFFGYIKVVDSLDNIDLEAVKAEVSSYETLVYPQEYFTQAAGASCCQ